MNKIAGLAAGTAWKEKVEPAFKRSGLDHELAFAYEAAFKGFVDVLRGPFVIDDAMDLRLREMFADDGFQKILAELPRARFEEVDTARARELFAGLGPPGASPEDFDFAWRTLGRVFSDRIAQTTHASKLAETYRQDRLESYLAEIAESVRPRDESAALAAYRRYVGDLYRLSDTQGLFWREKEPIGEEIRLADVFVEPLIQRQGLEYVPIETEFGGEVVREPIPLPERAQTVADVLAREQRLVILGPPGSGKSTLARCLALALVTEEVKLDTGLPTATVPILLPLKTYAASLRDRSNLPLDDFLEEQLARQLPDFDRILAEGRALVLFDGLDEVFDETHRRWVSAEVSRLMSLHPRSRFVLTSRPQGYRAAPVTGAVPLFEMVAFDDARIRKVFRGWFTALARHGYDHEPGRTPEQRADALANEVLGRPRIRSLAENPMLCTLIVLLQRSRSGHLPERRVKFYEAAVAVLTERWERAKHSPKQEMSIEFPEPEQMKGVLAEVAWKAQTELGGREIPADTLESWIEDALADDPGWSRKRRKAARDLLHVIRDRTGLLVDAGGNCFQFVHQSLQEYLVAFYLLDRLDETQCTAIWYFTEVGDDEEETRTAIEARLVDENQQVRFAAVEYFTTAGTEDEKIRSAIEARLMDEDSSVRQAASKFFGKNGTGDESTCSDTETLHSNEETYSSAVAQLAGDEASGRRAAIEYFAKIGAGDEKIIKTVEILLADKDTSVQAAAVEFFIETGLRGKASDVLNAFTSGSWIKMSGEMRVKLAAAIGRHAVEDDALLKRITEDRIYHFCRSRAFAAAAERRDEIRRMSTPLTTAKRTAMHCA